MPKRIWKDIPSYEGLYQVSNDGKVRSLDRIDTLGRKRKGRILKQAFDKKKYKYVSLCKDNKSKALKVHRLVAMTFIPNPNNYPIINHKDENPSNNHVSNLEWCTYKYNSNYGTRNERLSKAMKGKNTQKHTEETKKKMKENHADFTGAKHPQARKVMCLNNGMIFDCIKYAMEWCGLKGRSDIGRQIQGINKTAGKDPVTGESLQWKYIE